MQVVRILILVNQHIAEFALIVIADVLILL